MSFFDECYQSRANLTNKPGNWKEFWHSELQVIKSVPKSAVLEKKIGTDYKVKNQFHLKYNSVNNYQLSLQLVAASSVRKKLPTIIIFPDYVEKFSILKSILDLGFLVCLAQMRGHRESLTTINANGEVQELKSYGYFSDKIENPNQYYMRNLLLDGYQTIETLSEEPIVDSERIGVWGRGIGAAMALFVARFSAHVSSQVIESPSFCDLDNLHKSKEKFAKEIYTVIEKRGGSHEQSIKQNFRYFDGNFFAENLQTPSAFIANLDSKEISPKQTFILFNQIQGEKEMHIFTEDDPDGLEEQNKKTHQIVQEYFERTLGHSNKSP